jgi:hypothetical protein
MAGETLSSAHIHIGPGCLGLGLIVLAGVEADLAVHVIARAESDLPESPIFKALVKAESGEESVDLPVVTFSKSDTFEGLEDPVRDLIATVPELLVTIAATTDGLEERHGFLIKLAEARAQSGSAETTLFIPCENDPGKNYPSLKQKLAALDVECLDTLVNRLCPKVNNDNGWVEVIADEQAEWVIQAEPDHQHTLVSLGELSYVDFVPDVRPYETRKRWLVNGAHLALAIIAHAKRTVSIDEAASEPGRAQWLEKLHEVLIESLDSRYPGLDENQRYASRHVAAWTRHEHDVVRIMRRLRRANPVPFLDDLERKLVEPIVLLEDPWSSPQVRQVFNRLHMVLQRVRSYVDFKDLPSILPTLDRSVDVRTATRYKELLVPVMGEKAAGDRAEKLGVSLESHRVRAFNG